MASNDINIAESEVILWELVQLYTKYNMENENNLDLWSPKYNDT